MNEIPRVWVGCVACYNDGHLTGDWFTAIDCPRDLAEFDAAIKTHNLPESHTTPCLDGPHEELWVMDFEGFGGLLTGECSPAEAQRLAELIEPMGSDFIQALAAYVADERPDVIDESTVESFEDAFCGMFDSGADYAQDLAEETGALPAEVRWPLSCIDWDHAWRELNYGGDNYSLDAPNGRVWIFRSV
jgi:antirestriction protein